MDRIADPQRAGPDSAQKGDPLAQTATPQEPTPQEPLPQEPTPQESAPQPAAPLQERTLVVVACPGDGAVDVLDLDTTSGALTPLARAEGLPGVAALATGTGNSLYAACNGGDGTGPRALGLSLDPAGALAQGPARELPASSCFLALGPDGRELFSASYGDGRLDRVSLPGADDPPPATFETGANTHCVAFSPDRRFMYVTSLGDDRVSWFALGEDGAAQAAGGAVAPSGYVVAEPGSGPRYVRLNEEGDRAYVVHELTGDIAVYARDPQSGALDLRQRVSAVEGLGLAPGPVRSATTPDPGAGVVWAADLRLTPDGRFLYTTERSTSTIAAFAVQADGTLVFLDRLTTEAQPCGSTIDPTGQFLLVCGEGSDHVSSYRVGEDGSLETASRAETSAGPLAIECLSLAYEQPGI